MRTLTTFWAVLLGIALIMPELSAAEPGTNELEGKWMSKRKGDDGNEVVLLLEFKRDQFTFRMQDVDAKLLFFAKGKAAQEKAGSLKTLRLSKIEGGTSESDLQSVDDERSFVYALRYGSLLLASNFDKERDNEEPKVETYTKVSK